MKNEGQPDLNENPNEGAIGFFLVKLLPLGLFIGISFHNFISETIGWRKIMMIPLVLIVLTLIFRNISIKTVTGDKRPLMGDKLALTFFCVTIFWVGLVMGAKLIRM